MISAKKLASALTLAGLGSMIANLPFSNAVATPGGFEVVQPDSLASAMMMALIDEDNVMIIDKAENNRAVLDNGNPVWGAVMSLTDYTMRGLDMTTNPFCASGAVLGNGSWLVAGGNQGVGYGGAATNSGPTGTGPYKDSDGQQAIRLMNPTSNAGDLAWIDNAAQMTSHRWYPGIEVMTDGSVLLMGGAIGGGYINRNTYPFDDPPFQGGSLQSLITGGANPTWEFFPQKGNTPTVNNFMALTNGELHEVALMGKSFWFHFTDIVYSDKGLNMYPHTYLMPSGKLFMQANYSTTLWDMYSNDESSAYTPLDDMPNRE
jgi:hypothetical protein